MQRSINSISSKDISPWLIRENVSNAKPGVCEHGKGRHCDTGHGKTIVREENWGVLMLGLETWC
jgi:hypothetical protein